MGRRPTDGNDEIEIKISELIHFTERQEQARNACFLNRFVLYGGARGGGKSRWLRWMLLFLLLYWWMTKGIRDVTVALFCQDYPTLRDRQITKIKLEFPAILGEIHETKEDGLCFFLRDRFGGGKIALRNLDDPTKYKSAEFAAVAIDELTQLPDRSTFDILRGSLRWPGIARTIFMAGTNPDGVGNLWVRELWIERQFPPEILEAGLDAEFAFVQSLPEDNPYLDETYWQDLRSQPKDVQRAWIEGDWYVFAGQVFRLKDEHVYDPFEIPDYFIRKTGTDWGYAKPYCTLWGAKNPDTGRYIIYRETYQAGLLDSRQAKLIAEVEAPGEIIRTRWADPSMFTKETKTAIPTSSADTYAEAGIYLSPAVNDRLNGKRKVQEMLEQVAPDGLPMLIIFSTCRHLIRTLPALAYDKTRIEDVDTDGEDHAYDALRYLLTDEVAGKKQKQKPQQPNPWLTEQQAINPFLR